MTTPAKLEVRNVSYHYGKTRVLGHVSLEASGGEFVALMGANGAGKSTLLDIMAGLRQPSEGSVLLDDLSLAEWKPRSLARRLSHLPQSVAPALPFLAEQLVLMARYPHTDRWHESAADHQAVEHAMLRTNCRQFEGRRVSTLSGGERQRVLLAACLAQHAGILLLDEPSTFLDVDQQLHCFDVLREEASRGVLCIAVTHDLNLALSYSSRIIVLADGSVGADVPTAEAAFRSADWLSLFSSRLHIGQTPEGCPWVWSQAPR